jgi:NAD(P)-dependent dehydrogenase (short-subunit alcohol dehydrogenase family)
MNHDFENRVVVVTGATSGIGRACVLAFARRGAKVALTGRREPELRRTAQQLTIESAEIIPGDVTKEVDRERIIDRTFSRFGGIDVLVNAAGIIGAGSIENTTLEQWDEMLDINLRSVFRLTQLALPSLIARKGNVVNISSVAGTRSFPNVLAYCVSKAALDQFTRCASLELAPKGVRVNAVNPGVVLTNLHRASGMDEKTYAKFLERSKETHPIGRVGTPEEVADLVLFLASDNAGWITGVTYSIDGGRANTCAR